MAKFLLLIISISLYTISISQETEVYFGNIHKDPPKTYLQSMLGQHQNETFFIRNERGRNGEKLIETYDNSLNLKTSSVITKPNEELNYEDIFMIDGKFFCFLTRYDKESEKNTLYGTTFDKKGTMNPNLIELGVLDATSRRKAGTFNVDTSFGASKKMFLVFESPNYDKREKESFNFSVYDLNFKLLQKIELNLPYLDRDFSIYDYVLDNKGNIHILASVALKGDDKERGKQNHELKLLSYYTKNDQLKEHEIEIGENYLSEIKIRINKDNDLVLSGFYSDRGSYGMKGVFFIKSSIDKQKITSIKTTDFTTDFLELFMSERKAEKGKELNSYFVDHIIPKEDGGAIMIAEYYSYYQTCYTNPQTGQTTCTDHYLYNDIIVVNFDPKGSVIWWSKIPKRQHTTNDGGYLSGYAFAVSRDKIHFIFNDNPANLTIEDPRRIKNMNSPRKSVTNLVTINNNGEMVKKTLFNTKENKTIMRPKFHIQASKNQLIMYGDKGKSYSLARITFK